MTMARIIGYRCENLREIIRCSAIHAPLSDDTDSNSLETIPWSVPPVLWGSWLCPADNVNVNVNVEFKVKLHEQVRYMGTLQY